jgi:virginiamycin A acetyltransferase
MRWIYRLLQRLKSLLSNYPENVFFTKDHFLDQISHQGWHIGDFSYGRPIVIGGLVAKLHIGKYCSISENCSIILADHNLKHTSTYPFRNIGLYGVISPQPVPDLHAVSKGDIFIGNDVWIGRNTTILSGLTIGDGAVIGAGSVVTKNVPPYAIVVGNPGKIVRFRFDAETIERLLKVRWWDWDPQFVFQNSADLRKSPQDFLKRHLGDTIL